MNISPATTLSQLETIERLAWEIIPEFYAPYIPEEHCIFFVKKFQTVEAMQSQIANGFEYYLLNQGDEDKGYLGFRVSAGKISLSKLYLLKECRGKGIGTLAMNFVEEKANQYNIALVELEVSQYNNDSIAFYQHKGFSIQDLVIHHYENGYSIGDYRMIKNIIPANRS